MGLLDHLLSQTTPSPAEDNSTTPVATEVSPAKPAAGRKQLLQHIAWINQNLNDADPIERAQATLHAFSENFDGLDPETDAELIDAATNLFKAYNRHGDEDE